MIPRWVLTALLSLLPGLGITTAATESHEGRRVVIIGASGGIGKAIAEAFGEQGALLILGARRLEKLQEVAAPYGANATVIKVDGGVEEEIAACMELAENKLGGIDAVVWVPTFLSENSLAGLELLFERNAESSELDGQMLLNVKGMLWAFKHARRSLLLPDAADPSNLSVDASGRGGGGGAFVSISSVGGHHAVLGLPTYSMAKAAQEAAIKNLALEYGRHGLRAFAVAPASIETRVVGELFAGGETERRMANAHALGRVGRPREVAETVLFLASERSSFMTGSVVSVDGGADAIGSHSFVVGGAVPQPTEFPRAWETWGASGSTASGSGAGDGGGGAGDGGAEGGIEAAAVRSSAGGEGEL